MGPKSSIALPCPKSIQVLLGELQSHHVPPRGQPQTQIPWGAPISSAKGANPITGATGCHSILRSTSAQAWVGVGEHLPLQDAVQRSLGPGSGCKGARRGSELILRGGQRPAESTRKDMAASSLFSGTGRAASLGQLCLGCFLSLTMASILIKLDPGQKNQNIQKNNEKHTLIRNIRFLNERKNKSSLKWKIIWINRAQYFVAE